MSEETPVMPEASTSSPPLSPAPAEIPEPETITTTTTDEATSSVTPLPTSTIEPLPTITKLPIPAARTKARTKSTNGSGSAAELPKPPAMGITESIASAPAPRPTDFSYDPNAAEYEIDIEAALERASKDEDMPGSPTSKIMRAIAPPQASVADVKWPVPPPGASVNLFIGRALLANGNDNWPLKPNDITQWIRKHYPGEWDGDEGRCSSHRVRTYLARKGTDMYYEKLAQASISGWRIRQNHLWRFENGGFQGRGMKQEEALLEKAKEHEAAITDRHKAAAAEALAAGHPTVKTNMSAPGVVDSSPAAKRAKLRGTAGSSSLGNSRRKALKKEDVDHILAGLLQQEAQELENRQALELEQQQQEQQAHQDAQDQALHLQQQQHHHHHHDETDLNEPYYPTTYQPVSSGPSQTQTPHESDILDPMLSGGNAESSTEMTDANDIDMNMVHQAMQAAAGHIDDLDMGIQLPIEMQMHGEGEHDEHDREAGQYYGETYGMGLGTGSSAQTYWDSSYYETSG